MPETIVVQLNTAPKAPYYYLVFDEEGKIVVPATLLNLREISQQCQHKTLIVLLPPEETLLLTVKLPLLKKNQLLQAIPFAIQEALSGKVDDYRFTVLDEQEPSGLVHIAVVEKIRIQEWHQLLLTHHMEAHYAIPTLLNVPFEANSIKIMQHDNTCLVRSGQYSGFVTDTENVGTLLELHLAEINKPEKIVFCRYGATNHDETAFKNVTLPVETESLAEPRYFTDLATNALNNLSYNVLWGKLQARSKNQTIKLYWKITLGLAITLIAIALINKVVEYTVYSSQNATLSKKITAVYRQVFPNSTGLTAPRLRFEDKLKNLNAIATHNPYLNLLGTAGQALKDNPLLKINTLQFNNKVLSLDVTSQNFSDLNEVSKQLEAKGLNVTQRNAHIEGNTVSTTLLIKDAT